tara:strand:+ start:1135 stop:1323 length:189 start_codon:yes stop_codon:yes gene_type:complete
MGQYNKQNSADNKVSFTIQDTEMLLRILQSSQITGAEASAVAQVTDKVTKIHTKLLAKMEEV